ncbi:hypothetical protein [Pantoea phage vB_PagP-SK1]|uniref:Uncharacterized protein n=1 Tax=Pantoea phage vB_PagP-SK1 TaxID=2653646 RepID=A0A5P8NK68_9CAUD|nr:hypothetical protein [Pantoea phage vB_PagP-SK1]
MEQVEWCIAKLREALNDYNIQDAKNYLELLEHWKGKLK